MRNTKKYKFQPTNISKYLGNPTNIILRSSWETKFAIYCDTRDHILAWNSEEIVVPYICPTDNKAHRYFVDFLVTMRLKNDIVKTYLIEIKPAKEAKPPTPKGRNKQQFMESVLLWGKNEAKWKAATHYANKRGWEFKVLTEKELGIG